LRLEIFFSPLFFSVDPTCCPDDEPKTGKLKVCMRRVAHSYPEVGKVTFKINGDEALSDESVEKSNGDKALNDDFS
jgi:hypothetical protein